MKKDVVMFKNGSFVDFQGITHNFIVCAVSTSNFQTEEDAVSLVTYYRDSDIVYDELEIPRAVFIGVSVCNPGNGTDKKGDDWNEAKGKMIAEAKARGFKKANIAKSAALFATRGGLISEKLVEALLDREVEHIKEDPESVIKGYNTMKARWEEKQENAKYLAESPEELVKLGEKLASMSEKDIERTLSIALIKANE